MHIPIRLVLGRGRNHPRTVIRDAKDNLIGVVESGNDSDALKALVRAVNNHEALVAIAEAALKARIAMFSGVGLRYDSAVDNDMEVIAIRAALANATKE